LIPLIHSPVSACAGHPTGVTVDLALLNPSAPGCEPAGGP
jgi:hypothetical protein